MGETTIGWTATPLADGTSQPGYTFNLVIGCDPVSPGCAHCYARDLAKNRMGLDVWNGKTAKPRKTLSAAYWKQPLIWNRKAERDGVRHKVFCSSMADAFEAEITVAQERNKLWPLIEATPHLDWLLLTKRPENVMYMVPPAWHGGFPANVWLGTSVENQHWADIRIPQLLEIPARVRFLSCEPLLGPVNIVDQPYWDWRYLYDYFPNKQPPISWVICGGESGPKHRPMKQEWATNLLYQCTRAEIPFFFKQIGGRLPTSGGDLLDGVRYHQFPR